MARLTEGGLMTQSRQEIIEKLRGRVSRRAGIRDSISVIITLFGGQRKRALRQGCERGRWAGWGVGERMEGLVLSRRVVGAGGPPSRIPSRPNQRGR